MEQGVKYKGVAVFMDGKEWIVPSLSVRQFRDNFEKLTKDMGELSAGNFAEKLTELMPIIKMALNRNYPELSEDQILDMLDLSTFPTVIQAIAAASGMRKAEPGESDPVKVN